MGKNYLETNVREEFLACFRRISWAHTHRPKPSSVSQLQTQIERFQRAQKRHLSAGCCLLAWRRWRRRRRQRRLPVYASRAAGLLRTVSFGSRSERRVHSRRANVFFPLFVIAVVVVFVCRRRRSFFFPNISNLFHYKSALWDELELDLEEVRAKGV